MIKDINTNIDINGIKYSVFVGSADFPSSDFSDMVYYSYKEGLLRYDYSDTNYYEIKR